ncbi:MAG TPA: aminotransferase class V-fold PLP-dependent enzyme, partial [Steroidobacteraceae bacterium]|nr:aminotransferase class V-fold PLP-dependent enzyme [Steroidobacteraceae bacterium]
AFHSDCAQAAGKVPLDVQGLPVDFLSFTAHKLYGPKGAGALYVRASARGLLQPVTFGGGQEHGWRPGTLATHQIVGFGAACEIARGELPAERPRLTALRERLWSRLSKLGGVHLNGAGAPRVPGILNVSFEGVEGESLVSALPELAVSTGAACNSASAEASYVLRALGRDALLAGSSLRLSLGRFTRDEEVDLAAAALAREVARLRALSPASGVAGALELGAGEESGTVVSGEAGGPRQETWIRFHLLIAGDTVKDARFQAFGCPHTVDVAAWLCREVKGRARGSLPPGGPADWAASRSVPVEKLGRLLVIEDALRACLLQWP